MRSLEAFRRSALRKHMISNGSEKGHARGPLSHQYEDSVCFWHSDLSRQNFLLDRDKLFGWRAKSKCRLRSTSDPTGEGCHQRLHTRHTLPPAFIFPNRIANRVRARDSATSMALFISPAVSLRSDSNPASRS